MARTPVAAKYRFHFTISEARRRSTRAARVAVSIGRVAALCLACGVTSAQDGDFEQVIVTGSRIARPDFDSASPIVSVTQDVFRRNGSNTVESTLNTLPQFVPAFTSTSNNPANGGQANVSLRGLGPTATLVLVDGKRLMPANGNGVVDLNIIPSALIESVEIITGGASAVYGSDALAGVVNFKLKRDFDGVELDGSWGQTDRGDGTQYDAGLTAGTDFADGRGSIVGYVGYADRELVRYVDRDYSKYAMAYAGGPGLGTLGPQSSFAPAGSQVIVEGRVPFFGEDVPDEDAFYDLMESYGYDRSEVPYLIPLFGDNWPNTQFGFNADGTIFTTGSGFLLGSGAPAVANFRGEQDPVFFNDEYYSYNFAPDNALQIPLDRTSAFVRAEFEFGDAARAYVQGLYSDYSVTPQLAPTPVFDIEIPVNNPFVPADLKRLADSRPADPTAPLFLSKRMLETGPRTGTFTYDVYQATLGASGRVLDGWEYEAYVQVGANDQEDRQTGNVLLSRIRDLTHADDGGVSICGGFDPFGPGSISPECMDYISIDASNHASVDQRIVEVSMSGPLFELPAGPLLAAVGVFYKEDEYGYAASPEARVFLDEEGNPSEDGEIADIQGFVASDNFSGDDHNLDLYAEVLVPVLRDAPGARSLEAVLGYRSSDYASAGRFDSWKAEVLYQPVENIRLRSSYQDAVRAPSVHELYYPQLPGAFDFFDFATFSPVVDPCTAGSAERNGEDAASVEALCLAQGLPAALLPTFSDPRELTTGVTGGNPDLKPEEASTTTIGLVWTSGAVHPLLANLQLSVDWYRIDISNKIETLPFSEFLPFCYDARYNPEFSASNQWCSLFDRNAVSGVIEDVHEINANASDWETTGIDTQLDWRFDVGPGQLGVSWLVAWLDSFTLAVANSTAPSDEYAGTIGGSVGGSLPEWKSNLHVSYQWRDLTVGASWRYVDAMTDANLDLDPAFRIPSAQYFDLNANYEFSGVLLEGLQLGIGVENLTDEEPPIFPSSVQANTDPSQYDAFGRRYYVTLRYSF